jgi:hypothetical protein
VKDVCWKPAGEKISHEEKLSPQELLRASQKRKEITVSKVAIC